MPEISEAAEKNCDVNPSSPNASSDQIITSLKSQLANSNHKLASLELESSKNSQLFQMFDQKMREVQSVIETNNSQKRQYVSSLHKYLIELEIKEKREKRRWINEQGIRLGRLGGVKVGAIGRSECWEEGDAFRRINQRLREIQLDKDEIEKLKKSRKNKATKNKLPMVPDAFGVLNEQSEFDLEESEFNNIDKNEQKEIY